MKKKILLVNNEPDLTSKFKALIYKKEKIN